MAAGWWLKRGGVVLGTLEGCSPDMPWFFCRFTPTAAFEEVRSYFDEELQLLNEGRMDDWEKAFEAIVALGLRLEDPEDGTTIDKFILHVERDQAWFRY
jgi:hypothetical protein